ncbi:MAG: PQQ-binding-like beta-propeller repeat protein [Alphaproteobacteria bacterium]|nr:PQQ-binding-like beta-propeller repeat protein [Alphaproteobacteria bacterium]
MRRREVMLLAALLPAGCGLFKDKKTPLPGERISVLGLDRRLEPDPQLAKVPVTLPAPVVNPDWPQAGGRPNHAMSHLALPPQLSQAWQVGIGEGSARYTRVLSQPIVAKGRVYAMDGGVQLTALDSGGGGRVWQVDLKPENERGNAFGGGPTFWNDRLYVATGYAQVLALDPANGQVIWKQSVTGPVHSQPTVADGRIFVVTVENELIVLAVEDGRRLWSHNGIPETAGLLGSSSPAVEGEIAVVAYSSGELYALRVENGRPVWSDSLASTRSADAVSSLADIRGRPVIDRGRVFAISHSGRMAAIDVRTGDRVWEQDIASSHSPWPAGDYVFVLANDNALVCLSRNEGKVRWVRQLSRFEDEKEKSDPIRWAGPTLGGNRLIVLSSTGLAVLVAAETGEQVGQFELGDGAYLAPAIADNTLYVLTDAANLSAYR